MKNSRTWMLSLVMLFPLACSKSGDGPGTPSQPPPVTEPTGYQFLMVDDRWSERPFVVDLPLTNTRGVESFEKYVKEGAVAKDPEGKAAVGILSGTVVPSEATDAHKWAYHLDPATIEFADMTTELCDAHFLYVEEHLAEWMADVKTFCPWATSALVRRITKNGTEIYRRD